ncbi:MAG: serine/threonine-protein kinase [Myxococcota bacterium]
MDPRARPARLDADRMLAQVRSSLFETAPVAIDRFEIRQRLGSGGMGTVYEAYDPQLDRAVALKVLRADASGTDSDTTTSPLREARAAARVVHPNVVAIHEVGQIDHEGFVAMELVPGHTLRAWLTEAPRPTDEVIEVMLAAGRGLAAAHEAGLVHRDFKPDNVLIREDGQVKVVDFGLARMHTEIVESSTEPGTSSAPDPSASVTCTWAGTPAYMAPEQHDGAKASPRSDQFAFCISLFEALYGERPFAGRSRAALALAVREGEVEFPRRKGVSRAIAAVLRRGLQTEPEHRWPDMASVLDALRRARRRPRLIRLTALLATTTVAAVTLGWMARPTPEPTPAAAVDPGPSCDDGLARLRGVWDEQRREAVVKTVGAPGPDATAIATTAAERLDAYGEQWAAAHDLHCVATRDGEVRPGLEAQTNRCLERRRDALGALVDVLAGDSPVKLHKVVTAVDNLPSIDDCQDERLLGILPDPPSDPEVARRVRELTPRVAKVYALNAASLFEDAVKEAEITVVAAREIGHLPLLADALQRLGQAQSALFRDEARATLEEAVLTAEKAGYDLRKIDVLIALANNAAHIIRKYDAARDYLRRARASLDRIGGEPGREIRMLSTQAGVHWMSAEYDEALAAAKQAIELCEATGREERTYIVSPLSTAAMLHTMKGEPDLAMPYYQRALKILAKTVGPTHASTMGLRNNIALNYGEAGDYDAEIREFRELMKLHEQRGEKGRIDSVRTLRNLCRSQLVAEYIDDASSCIEDAVALARDVGYEPDLVLALVIQTEIHAKAGRTEQMWNSACTVHPKVMKSDEVDRKDLLPRLARKLGVTEAQYAARCRGYVGP